MRAVKDGRMHLKYEEWCKEYGGTIGCNIVVPTTVIPKGNSSHLALCEAVVFIAFNSTVQEKCLTMMSWLLLAILKMHVELHELTLRRLKHTVGIICLNWLSVSMSREILKPEGVAFLGDGVLSTRDNESWKEQRRHLSEAFMPKSSLAHIFPVSRDRAEYAVQERLARYIE